MQYTERVIKEVLRYFTVVPAFARSCPEDFKLPSGHIIPRSCQVVFCLPDKHRDSRWFPDPDRFDPDRFLPENSRSRHPFAFVPFSAGPRNCVGQRYAMMLLKVEVATLLRRFKVLPAPALQHSTIAQVPIKVTLVIAVKGGVQIRVERRATAGRGGE